MLEKKYEFKEIEPKLQKFWEGEGIYHYEPDSSKGVYSIDTPPPTVSGNLHIGHIFSYTQAEMIARFHRMQGQNVFYPFGFDDNGLPTERLVEKEEGIIAQDMPRSEFIKKCMSTTQKYEAEFKELWQSLGFSIDWSLQYETISPLAQRISQRSFLDLARKGKAYLKETPVLWCTSCQTSIAQAELDSLEKEAAFNWIPFQVEDEELIVATTRPELLCGCVALLIHPEDERYVKYIGKEAIVPLYDFPIPILGDKKVSKEKGTGIVMCATFGDTTDLEWYNVYRLPYKKIINPDGTISDDVPFIHGLNVGEAREKIINKLREEGLLKRSEKILHTVAVHERCGKDIEIITSKQWFIDILNDKDKFLDAADKINWYPSSMKTRYEIWVQNLKWDWCISRQRYFGVPFPLWYCKDCGSIIFAREEDLPVNPLESSPKEPCSCGSNSFIPEDAVMDTWATSSLTPMINSKWGEKGDASQKLLPMNMRTQAHEIIRTWAFYTIVKSIYHTGQIPWKDIMICGFVMAKQGEKISKSKNNASLSPKALIDKYSADGIRYWAANSKLGTDTMFSEDELQTSNRFLTKLWNAARFSVMHLGDYQKQKDVKLMPIDRWIVEKYKDAEAKAAAYLEQYEVGAARYEIDEFFWKDYCDNYLEIVKERLYKPEIHGYENRLSAQFALYTSFLGILKTYAIYVPHIVEEIYQAYFREYEETASIHKTIWSRADEADEDILRFGETVKQILLEIRRYKSERNLSLKTEVDTIRIFCPQSFIPLLEETRKDLHACTGAKTIEFREGEGLAVIIGKGGFCCY
ncbi:MAG: Valyl-tRNA synthetase [Firmicutes bacterium]|nr:Valyl-tRNA synthetase [Bacillota bacterium]